MDAAITFFISLVLLVAFIVFRFWEEKRAKRTFPNVRTAVDSVVADMYHGAVTGDIPKKYQTAAVHFFYMLVHDTIVFLVEGLRAIERLLSQLSYRLRRSVPSANGKEPSAFLKTITPEKPADGANAKTPDSI